MRSSRRLLTLIGAAAAVVAAVASMPAGAADWPASAPRPSVAPNGQHGFPFRSSALNLSKLGYVEQEYLLSGTALAYIPVSSDPLPSNGRWNVKPNPGVTAP